MIAQDIEKLIEEFNSKLKATHFNVYEWSYSELKVHLDQIFKIISEDYSTYRKHISMLLAVLESCNSTSIEVLIQAYVNYYEQILKIKVLQEVDESILNKTYNNDTPNKLFGALKQSLNYGQKIRISNFRFNSSSLSKSDKLEIISLLVDYLQDAGENLEWDNDTVQNVLIQLPILRCLLNENNNYIHFYFLSGIVMDRYASSEYYQQSRDLAEELILTSYLDHKPYLGYFNSFRCYSNSSSAIPGLIYANLSLCTALSSSEPLCTKYIKDIIWQGIKFFRNINFHPMVQVIYEKIPIHLTVSDYERRSIAHSYFLSLLQLRSKELPELIVDFLNQNREQIYTTGVNDALPWLVTLYNIQRLYPDANFSSTALGYYLNTFEMIVPTERSKELKAKIFGDIDVLKSALRHSLIKLHETRNASDLVHDNETAIKYASRLIVQAVQNNDIETLLLAMMVKADYSFVFLEKEREETAPVNIPNKDIEAFQAIYGSLPDKTEKLKQIRDISFLWLIFTEGHVYQLQLAESEFTCEEVSAWNNREFNKLSLSGFFSDFTFDTSIKKHGQVRMIFPEEHEEESNNLKSNFLFASINVKSSTVPFLVVMDMSISGFPHNLLLDSNKDFLYLQRPICNILSTEWYLKYANTKHLDKSFSKSIWIPTQGGDWTLAELYSKLEDYLLEGKFEVIESIVPTKSISSDINIISAHGAKDIALKQAIYPDHNPRINLSKFLGDGKILIFLVCHSGSVKETPFENSISTLVKEYLIKGYAAVIAPFWALRTDIPPIWLPVFINSLYNGETIVEAVHKANITIYNTFPTLSAWSCMHLYGDPHLKVN